MRQRRSRLRLAWLPALALAAAPWTNAAFASQLVLSNGDVLSGTVVQQDAERVILDHPVLGRLEIPAGSVIEPPGTGVDASPGGAVTTAPGVGARLAAWLEHPDWDRSVELGISGSEGNTDIFDLVAAVDLESEAPDRRWRFLTRYFHSTSENRTTKSQGRAELLRDWLLPGRRLFAFGEARYDYDRFEPWDHRLSLGAGPGYDFLEDEVWTVRGRSGLYLTRTFGAPGRDEIRPEAGLGVELHWRPDARNEIELSNAVRANLRDPGEFRNLTRTAWKIRLSEEEGLALKLGIENEWESDVAEDEEKNDLSYYGTLVVDF